MVLGMRNCCAQQQDDAHVACERQGRMSHKMAHNHAMFVVFAEIRDFFHVTPVRTRLSLLNRLGQSKIIPSM